LAEGPSTKVDVIMFKGSHISIYAAGYAIEKWLTPTMALESLSSHTSWHVIKRKKKKINPI